MIASPAVAPSGTTTVGVVSGAGIEVFSLAQPTASAAASIVIYLLMLLNYFVVKLISAAHKGVCLEVVFA